ncbi:MAG TPA: pyridoxamine 5'-phosphate oxidase [Burkholderiaceae bacterium]|nr:pyridoxamine 5'-phosphate oxidase [Burkholderiaceae bacterium]
MTIAHLRSDYARGKLDESTADADPIRQFRVWFEEALAAQVREPSAMTLATADKDGRPSARIVLLKGFDADGFSFFTNYGSRKGEELAVNPHACLLFFWAELERQVKIEGNVTRASSAESDVYFAERPLASRIGAWASPQSRPIPDRAFLEARAEEYAQRFAAADTGPPRPPHWGGYRVWPTAIEFWQGRPSRLHDRLLYLRKPTGWERCRLAP